jgi:thiol-disulfide isomerase/thioredoxin
MFNLRALGVTVLVAVLLAGPTYFYWQYLTRGMRPPEATQRLVEMETNGVPDFTLSDLSGRSVSLHQFKGKVVLVNFWATWCAPCVKEFPSLQNLVKQFKGEIVVLAVSFDHQREDIESFIKAFGGTPPGFQVLWDPERSTSKLYGTDVLPETYILNGDHKLLRKIAGEAKWDEPMALQFFADIVNPLAQEEPAK